MNALGTPSTTLVHRGYCTLDEASKSLLRKILERLNLCTRAYDRILKVDRTIVHLENTDAVLGCHIGEAIQYRSLDREG
ncbi:ATP-binding protein [Maribacter polysiphoniae]|uniref:ATP-binding protein n=1 Tax=Maribacter polysiphoniae TaxID=429344 RepID=A0ABR7W1J8_9FLAO|nr:ATP-binding protein [Maribacter polysiphoniae]